MFIKAKNLIIILASGKMWYLKTLHLVFQTGNLCDLFTFHISSLQCYSVLSDILVENELCIPLEGDQMFYLLVKVSIAYLHPESLKSLSVSVLSTKGQFRSVL